VLGHLWLSRWLRVRKNCNISAIICPISIKFGTMMQNMSLEFMAVKNSTAKITPADSHHLENRKIVIS